MMTEGLCPLLKEDRPGLHENSLYSLLFKYRLLHTYSVYTVYCISIPPLSHSEFKEKKEGKRGQRGKKKLYKRLHITSLRKRFIKKIR